MRRIGRLSAPGPLPRRGLKLLPLVGLVFCLSAAGPFGVEEMVPELGPGFTILLILLLPVLFGLPLALASAEMGSRFPVEGGYYRWVRTVFGDFWGFQVGWWTIVGSWFDTALYAVLVAEYTEPILRRLAEADVIPDLGVTAGRQIACYLIIAICTLGNLRGIQVVGYSSLLFTIFILSPFFVLCTLGFLHWDHSPIQPFMPPDTGLLTVLGTGVLIGIWNYSGYESLSTVAEEIEDPRRNYLKAVLIAIALTVPTYLLPLLVTLAITPDWAGLSAGSFIDVGWIVGGAVLGTWISFAGVICNFALFNAYTLAYSRIPFSMAQDGFLPKQLALTHRKYGTPWVSLLMGAVIYAILSHLDLKSIIVLDMWLFCMVYIFIFLAMWRLRWRPDLDPSATSKQGYRFTIPLGRRGLLLIIIPPIAIALIAMFGSGSEYVAYGGPALLSGFVLYPLVRRLRRRHAGGAGGQHPDVRPGDPG